MNQQRTTNRLARTAVGVGKATLTVAGRVFYPRLRMAILGLLRAVRRFQTTGSGRP